MSISPDRLDLTLPTPPSINHQYATVNGRRILSAKGRSYKAQVAQLILVGLSRSPHRHALLDSFRSCYLGLSVRFFFATPLRRDVDGGLKITQDAICEALGIDDTRILHIHLFKSLDARRRPHIEACLFRSDPEPPDMAGTPPQAER